MRRKVTTFSLIYKRLQPFYMIKNVILRHFLIVYMVKVSYICVVVQTIIR